MKYIIEDTKTSSGTRIIPMTEEVHECFKRIVENRKKPKKEPVIDGYKGFLFLDKKVCRKLPCIGKNILNGHESIRNNYLRSHLMFADILIAVTWQKAE